MSSKECKKKRVVTDKMIAANRENAKKSTGPKTTVGKEISRRNSLKHGMTSSGIVVPRDLETQMSETEAKWVDQLHPEGYVEEALIRRAVACSVNLDWLDRQFRLTVAKQTRDAAAKFDARERAGALLEAQALAEAPCETVELLKNSLPGCAWLIDEWSALLETLEAGLNDDQVAHALRLMGIDPSGELTPGQSNIRKLLVRTQTDAERPLKPDGTPWDAESIRLAVHGVIQERIDDLNNRMAEIAPLHETARLQSLGSAMLPFGKNGALWPRYQGINTKGFHQAIHDLIKIRTHDKTPRPDDFRRDPKKERARNEAVRDAYPFEGSGVCDDLRASFDAEAAKEREHRREAKRAELMALQNEAKAALKRREERLGGRSRNEPVGNPRIGQNRPIETPKTNPIGRFLKAACVLLVFLLGASALGSRNFQTASVEMPFRPSLSDFSKPSNAPSVRSDVRNGVEASSNEPVSPAFRDRSDKEHEPPARF